MRASKKAAPRTPGVRNRPAAALSSGVKGNSKNFQHTPASADDGGEGEAKTPIPMTGGDMGGGNSPYSKTKDNLKVFVRVRPPLPREREIDGFYENTVEVLSDGFGLAISANMTEALNGQGVVEQYTFDKVYDQSSPQVDVYEGTAREAVLSTLEG